MITPYIPTPYVNNKLNPIAFAKMHAERAIERLNEGDISGAISSLKLALEYLTGECQ